MGEPQSSAAPLAPVPFEVHYALDKFLALEARLLDQEQYQDWLALLAEDIRYVMPVPANTQRRNRPGRSTLDAMYIYNEGHGDLKQRVAREETGMVWLNDPPTRHVRIITNVEAETTDIPDLYRVHSKFMLFRSRRERDLVSHVGWREDMIRATGVGYCIAHRTIHLPERVILDKNLNMFF